MQARVKRAIDSVEVPPDSKPLVKEIEAQRSHDWVVWNKCHHLQAKLVAESHDLQIPPWAVPDVLAAWMAKRNKHGRGWSYVYFDVRCKSN